MQNDPHNLYPRIKYFYLFLIVAPVLVGLMIFAAAKAMQYLDKLTERKRAADNKSSFGKNSD